jgi:hypothetical protein
LKGAKIKHINAEVFISTKSHQIAPFQFEKRLDTLLNTNLNFCDSVVIEVGNLNDKRSSEKYQDPDRVCEFLENIKTIHCKSLGLMACFEREMEMGILGSDNSVSGSLLSYSNFLNKRNPKIFIRLSDKIPIENFKRLLLLIGNYGLVHAIILDADLDLEKYDNEKCEYLREYVTESNKKLRLVKKILGENFPLISAKGINNAEEIYERIKNGANLVLIDSLLDKKEPICLEKLIIELDYLMKKHNDNDLNDIRKKGLKLEDFEIENPDIIKRI